MKTIFSGINYIFAIVLSTVAIIMAISAVPAFGNRSLIVKSGSMEPAIKVGDLVVVQTGKSIFGSKLISYKNGDIIAFKNAGSEKVMVTHRIVGEESKNNQTFYKTKGDANAETDNWLVAKKDILGKADTRLPYIGKILSFVKSKYGFPLVIAFPAVIVILFESFSIYKEIRRQKSLYRTQQPGQTFAHLRIIIPIFFSVLLIQSTFAYFSDTEQSNNNTFTASAIFPQPIANHIVISEVQIDGGPTNTTHDFIELYNPTNSPLDLNGHRLIKRPGNSPNDTTIKSWTSSTIIQAHGFYLWASSNDQDSPFIAIADTTTTESLGADTSIALRNGPENTGALVDVLSWNDGSTLVEGNEFDPDPGINQSMERKALSSSTASSMAISGTDEFKGNGFDSNDNATDFVLRAVSQPQNTSSATESP